MKTAKKVVTIRVRCWVDIDGVKFFGPGRAELLEGIVAHGSISKAAQAMGMSYKKAWAMIDEMNAMAKSPYVITNKGGTTGGGAEVTDTGKNAIARFNKFNDKIIALVKSETDLQKI
jgi:molybdate transport system regulatory protein